MQQGFRPEGPVELQQRLVLPHPRGATATQQQAALAWAGWEGKSITLLPSTNANSFTDPHFALAFARIENHYFVNGGFFEVEDQLLRDAHLLSEAGCFGIVLEKIPAALAARVTSEISAPTIGIGAGNGCDGQVLVIHDMLGINKGFSPRFLRRYADLYTVMSDAVSQYITDVKSCDFPNGQEQY